MKNIIKIQKLQSIVRQSEEKVDQIRELHRAGKVGNNTLGKVYDVNPATIKSIVKGKTWPEDKRKYFLLKGVYHFMGRSNLERVI